MIRHNPDGSITVGIIPQETGVKTTPVSPEADEKIEAAEIEKPKAKRGRKPKQA